MHKKILVGPTHVETIHYWMGEGISGEHTLRIYFSYLFMLYYKKMWACITSIVRYEKKQLFAGALLSTLPKKVSLFGFILVVFSWLVSLYIQY